MKKKYKDMKVYFASPWFNETQAEREDRVKNKLRDLGFKVWSPKDECICSPNADEELRKKVFCENCRNLTSCDILFAITDEKDMGTIWEAGFVNGLNECRVSSAIVVYYCETLGNNAFNLMLAQSGDIVITKFEDLEKLPDLIERKGNMRYAGTIE